MNIIKKVVVFVMGIVVIGVVSTIISVVTQPKNVKKNITFELLVGDTITNGTYNSLIGMVDIDNVILKVNDNIVDIDTIINDNNSIVIPNDFGDLIIYNNDTYFNDGFGVSTGDIISITFDVEQETPAIIKTLLVLIPLVFTASLIGYLSLSTMKGDKNE